jgi:outer membrane protein
MTPFVGAGINYTTFWDDRGTGVLAGTPISLDDSWGYALHAGVDFAISEKAAIRTDLRYVDIETDATVGGAPAGKVKIDPVVFGVSYVMKF